MLAFELVEICHPKNARFFGSAGIIGDAIEKLTGNCPTGCVIAFTSRFAGKPLSFTFDPDASLNKIRRILPRLFAEIVDQPETFWTIPHLFKNRCRRISSVCDTLDVSSFLTARLQRCIFFSSGRCHNRECTLQLRHRYETPHLLSYLHISGVMRGEDRLVGK